MKINELKSTKGSRRHRKRLGCGQGSGHGGTSTRGNKGSGQHASRNTPPGFEGGQMPLIRRLPKRGFRSHSKKPVSVLDVSDLDFRFTDGEEVTPEKLVKVGLARDGELIRILGNGDITKALKVQAHHFSRSARMKIEAAGGNCAGT